jgi:phage shock protein PspC (stress-responsive transcriptional regulator)
MTADSIIDEIKQALNGRPGQPIVLGVCNTVARKLGKEVWCVRLATIVLTLFWTLPAIAAYVIAGLMLKETEHRTRGFFTGLGILVRETAEKVFSTLGGIFDSERSDNSRSRSY